MFDVYVLESTGYINHRKEGYAKPIVDRLQTFGYSTKVIPLKEQYNELQSIPNGKPIIISGGMTEVFAQEKWLIETKKFIGKIIESNKQKPVCEKTFLFGICFGAQLISEVIQPGAVKFLHEPQIGEKPVTLCDPSPLFENVADHFYAYAFHYNQIQNDFLFVLSEVKKEGMHFINAFENQDLGCFGTQFHPEFTGQEFKTLLEYYNDQFQDQFQIDTSQIIRSLKRYPNNAIILENFMKMAYTNDLR
ncbi:type 1 glutamine amidotransferase [Fervidibacillus albus]|uniref:Glutamine amidotransferase domain-containing protein n=1 Tax=Fervidibacillus albus TaxID=2980026 RepID=A0A9E8RV67_9BACI|nr:hypothetical protein [Fervidibacillus albus]WAA08583.1 hypothetical protein OE104_07975 [Fervidibacillus albus]